MTLLTRPELERLTGRVRYSAQRRALKRLRIPYTEAATGEPLVRADALDGKAKPAQRPSGHRWERIGSIRNLRP